MDASDFNVQGPQDQNVQNAFPFVSATVAKDKAKLCVPASEFEPNLGDGSPLNFYIKHDCH